LANQYDLQIRKRVSEVFQNGFELVTRIGRKKLEKTRDQLVQHLTFASLSSAAIQFSDIQEKLAGKSGDISDAFRAFARDTLGNEETLREQVGAVR
jgi:hypothetical protein